jgi:hypothetical protein
MRNRELVQLNLVWYNEDTKNALRCSSVQGSGQTDAGGLAEAITAQESCSRQPAAAGEGAAFCLSGADAQPGNEVPELRRQSI